MTAQRPWRARRPGGAQSLWVGLALLALPLAAVTASNRDRHEARQDLRELYLERGRQLLLAGDWQRSLVYLSEVYSGAEADAGLRFLVARAVTPLRARLGRSRLHGDSALTSRGVRLAADPGTRRYPWASADLSHDWTRIVAADAGGGAAIFDPLDGRRLVELAGASPGLAMVRFSPDGEHVAGGHADGGFSLWRGDTGELVLSRKPPPGQVPAAGEDGRSGTGPAIAFFAGGRRLITATEAGTVRIWDTADGASLASFDVGSGGAFAFRPDGRRLVIVADHGAMIWNLETGKPIVSLDLPRQAVVHSLAYSPDGRHILTAGESAEVRLFDAASGELEALLSHGGTPGHTGSVCCAAFSPAGGLILTAGDDRTARIWDAERGQMLASLPLPASEVIDAEYGPRAATIATVHADGTLNLWPVALEDAVPAEIRRLRSCFVPWRLASGRLLPATPDPRNCRQIRPSPENHGEDVAAAVAPAVAPVPARRVSSKPSPLPIVLETSVRVRVVDLEGKPIPGAEVRLWSAGTALTTLRHDDAVLAASFSPDGQRLVTACRDGAARIWATATAESLGEPMRHGGAVSSAAFSPDGRQVVTASADGTARIWTVSPSSEGRSPGEPLRHGAAVRSAVFSSDGRRLATASTDGTARLWQSATGRPLGKPLFHDTAVSSAAFSPSGRRLVTASHGTAQVWELASRSSQATPMRHPTVRSAVFGPDGRRVLTVSWDGTVRLWWVVAGQPSDLPSGSLLDRGSLAAAFSPDGDRLATAGWDGSVRVWRLSDQIDRVVGEHQGPVYSVAFSSDGRWLATASEDGTARVWSAERSPGAESLRALPPVATTDRQGEVRIEVGRTRQPALLVSRTGYRTPDAYPLPSTRGKTAFIAELAADSSPPGGGETEQRPSRIHGLPAEPAGADQAVAPERSSRGRWVGESATIVLKNADLLETLRSFASISDLNMLFAPGIEGTITAEFPNVPWDQAFEEILRAHDLVYVWCCPPFDPPSGAVLPPFGSPEGTMSFDQQVSIDPLETRKPSFLPVLGLIMPQDGRTLAPKSPTLAELVARPSGVPSHLPPSGGPKPPSRQLEQFLDVPEDPSEPVPGSSSGEAKSAQEPPAPVFPSSTRPQGTFDVTLFEAQAARDDRARFPGEPIDMSLKHADLAETLRSFATISDLHWTVDPDIAGTVSAELKGVPWDQALTGILRLHDLRLEVSGNSVRIRRWDRGGGP